MTRQIVLDTETTGLEPEQGHRVIEIGAVEIQGRRMTRRHFHEYLNPERAVDEGALEVHGITSEFLADKPRFVEISEAFLEFIRGAELVIHNAPFDVGFLNAELERLENPGRIETLCEVTDTLVHARQRHPGQKNSLDALCRRYEIDNGARELHGALLDAEILAEVYLAMTGGQTALILGEAGVDESRGRVPHRARHVSANRAPLRVVGPSAAELEAHRARIAELDEASAGGSLWSRLES